MSVMSLFLTVFSLSRGYSTRKEATLKRALALRVRSTAVVYGAMVEYTTVWPHKPAALENLSEYSGYVRVTGAESADHVSIDSRFCAWLEPAQKLN